jgi:hypothetical protein
MALSLPPYGFAPFARYSAISIGYASMSGNRAYLRAAGAGDHRGTKSFIIAIRTTSPRWLRVLQRRQVQSASG